MKRLIRTAVAVLMIAPGVAGAGSWPDSPLARVEAVAILQTLNATLLSHPSATVTLENWCRDHHLAPKPRIVARRVAGAEKPMTAEQRQDLSIEPREDVP
jgi:hypothetical protein